MLLAAGKALGIVGKSRTGRAQGALGFLSWVFLCLVGCGNPASAVLDLESVSGPPIPDSVPSHTHRVVIPAMDIQDRPVQRIYTTTTDGNPKHHHTLTLLSGDFADLKDGRTVFLLSSETGIDSRRHAHSFVLTP